MIQRVQTVFLLLAFILQTLMLFLPIAEYSFGNQLVVYTASGFTSVGTNNTNMPYSMYIFVLLCLFVFIPLIITFLYKRRKLQMRLCLYYIIFLILFQAVVFWFSWNVIHQLEAVINYKIPIIFPVVSAILSYLAFLSVRKDERLIRSVDRIR